MYNKQEKKVLNLLRQVEEAFNELVNPNDGVKRRKQDYNSRRSDSVVHDKDATAFRQGLTELERNLKARAADRLNELDVSDYVKEFIKDQHPGATDIDFKVTFTNKEVLTSHLEVTPSKYGGLNTNRVNKPAVVDSADQVMEDDDDDQEDDCR